MKVLHEESEKEKQPGNLKFSICLDTVYTQYDYYDRVKYAAQQGYDGIELWNIGNLDLERLENICTMEKIKVANMNAPDTWRMNLSEATFRLQQNMADAFKIAEIVHAEHILLLAGDKKGRHSSPNHIIADNLKYYAEYAEKYRVKMGVEALNTIVDHPKYILDSSADAFEIIKVVNSPWVGTVFDIYHMQIMEGNIIANIIENIDLISHIHSAGCPGRHEHAAGELNYPVILRQIARTSYQGYIGSEYWPAYDNMQSPRDVLVHLKSYLDQ